MDFHQNFAGIVSKSPYQELKIKNKLMKKIINFLLVKRPETENKWWHRLFTVILFGSAIVLFISIILLTADIYKHAWFTHRITAFSLESNYQQAEGQEFPCNWSIDTTRADNEPIKSVIKCKGVEIPLTDARTYGALYDTAGENLRMQYGLDKYNGACSNLPQNPSGKGLSKEEITCLNEMQDVMQTDPTYNEYQNASENLAKIKIKVSENTNLVTIFSDIFVWLTIPILVIITWIIFWSAIVYRTLLYVIFGKKK